MEPHPNYILALSVVYMIVLTALLLFNAGAHQSTTPTQNVL